MLQAGSFAGLLPFPLLSHSFVQPLLIIEGPSHAQGQLDWGVTLVGLVERGKNIEKVVEGAEEWHFRRTEEMPAGIARGPVRRADRRLVWGSG